MTSVAIYFFLTVTNIVSKISATSFVASEGINGFQEHQDFIEADVFALQIKGTWATSEAPPVAFNGNNLNLVPRSQNFLEVNSKNIQSTPIDNRFNDDDGDVNKKHKSIPNKSNPPNREKIMLALLYENAYTLDSENFIKLPQPLISDDCSQTSSNDKSISYKNDEFDMEIFNRESVIQPATKKYSDGSEFLNNIATTKIQNAQNVTISTKWLDKYNDLKNAKYMKRRQTKLDFNPIKKTTDTTTTFSVLPITINIDEDDIEINKQNTEETITAWTDNIEETRTTGTDNIASYADDWYDSKEKAVTTKIQFSGFPQRDIYSIPSLYLEDGFYPFKFMSEFFALINPFDYPAGLIKDIVWGQFDFPYSFLQSIKVESVFLVFIIIFVCLALIIPAYLIIMMILTLLSDFRNNDELETGTLFPELEDTNCNERVQVVGTLLLVLFCCILISGMVISNEQATTTVEESRNVLSCACADIATWLASAARELHHSLVPPVDLVLQAFREDLRNVESLLGEPIQKTISSESGIDLVLESLNDVISESEDISGKITSLRDICAQAGALASSAADRLRDLSRQLLNLKKHCLAKDLPLCDTLNTHSMELRTKFDLILHEKQLLELRSLGVENLTRAIMIAKQDFRGVPAAILGQTAGVRDDILKVMQSRRDQVYYSSRVLSDIVRYLTASLHTTARKIETSLFRFKSYDFWRWIILLSSAVLFMVTMFLTLFAMICGCSKTKEHAKRTLRVSTVWICAASILLWTTVSAVFLIAGHAEVYICHALWDAPQYTSLSKLLDRPSPLFAGNEGVFDAMFKDLGNISIDVTVRDFLRDCEKDRPAYNVFQLDKVLDVNKETSYFEWVELQRDLGRLATALDVGFLRTVSKELNRILNEMLAVSDVDLAKYRMEYNGPVVTKDLVSLADQLVNVAAQVTDLTTSGRLETLATRTQRLHLTTIKPLEQLRADVVFKLTELELQLVPFRRKLNISLSHIHTAQYYIDNQGDVIAQKKTMIYKSRLTSHVAGWRTYVLTATSTQAAKCKPLFSVYSAARTLLCSHYVASLHGWWVCGLVLGICWCALTPLCIRLWRMYNKKIRARSLSLTHLAAGQQETPTTAMCESNNWSSPRPPPPPRSDSW